MSFPKNPNFPQALSLNELASCKQFAVFIGGKVVREAVFSTFPSDYIEEFGWPSLVAKDLNTLQEFAIDLREYGVVPFEDGHWSENYLLAITL